MTDEQRTVALFAILMTVAWSGFCWAAGAIWGYTRGRRHTPPHRRSL